MWDLCVIRCDFMGTGIIVCGCNGSGKSTLGRELAKALGYKFIDIEDVFFHKGEADYIYDYPLPYDDVVCNLRDEISNCENFVFAAVKGNYGRDILLRYKYAIFVNTPRELRLQRIRERSLEKFGERILAGGDLYEKEQRFFDMAALRTEQEIEEWLAYVKCDVIRVDGTKPVAENVRLIIEKLTV